MSKRLYKSETLFELALRLTQTLKNDEYFIMRYKESGEVYVDSMSVLNTIHEALSELEPEDAYHDFRVENLKSNPRKSYDEGFGMCSTMPNPTGSPFERHRYDHYSFNGESYDVDWANLEDDDYREFGR